MQSDPEAAGRPLGIPDNRIFAWCALAYVAAALGIDTLAFYEVEFVIDWGMFKWMGKDVINLIHQGGAPFEPAARALEHTTFHSFDVFKFLAWFLIPFLMCLPWMDWRAWGWARWKRSDWYLLGALLFVAVAVVFSIPFLPGIRHYYRPVDLPLKDKFVAIVVYATWTISWLPGWEFLHRYLLLRSLQRLEIKYDWLIVPFVEALYHLPKQILETAGMFLYGFLATRWTKARGSWLLPLLFHLSIELSLAVFMVGLFS
ncbi:MAG: hypothetical protein GC168_04730 [Candidatus Hydrogenedens sp.]|nr:hypothetical protein [Candidatus Hydrogenedens sp.]